MKEEMQEHLSNGVRKVNTAVDWVSVALVFLFPIVSGLIFYSVMYMGGAPGWFFVILGIIFAGSLIQAIYYVIVILIMYFHRNDHAPSENGNSANVHAEQKGGSR